MKVKIELLSDTIFGSGISVPGAEDISIQYDSDGFPYLKGSTFRGVFKQEFINYLYWIDEDTEKNYIIVEKLFGKIGYADSIANDEDYIDKKLKISDFNISDNIKKIILSSDNINSEEILASLTYIRTFTSIENSGISKIGSLRNARCIKKGLIFLGDIDVDESYEELVSEVLKCIKWLGSMRTRGFGNVKISVAGGID
mgnify:CR=1 FL=1